MNEIMEKDNINIENIIYEVRGNQVILDRDLAKLYKVETKRINEAVKNNPDKFPERFSFILNNIEKNNLWSKISTANISKMSRTNSRVFTEQGVAMLATILKSKTAIEVSIKIMDAFVAMRHYLTENKDIYKSLNYINNKIIDNDNKFDYIFSKFDKKEWLFLKGEVYDAYSIFINIFKETKTELIIIDSYADNTLLDIIRTLSCKVILITKNSERLSNTIIDKYNKEYHNLTVIRNNTFHDRYFIIDRSVIYHSGSSINNAGDKTFSINILGDIIVRQNLINNINTIISEI